MTRWRLGVGCKTWNIEIERKEEKREREEKRRKTARRGLVKLMRH